MKNPAGFLKYLFLFLGLMVASLLIYFIGYDKGAHDIFVESEINGPDSVPCTPSIWDHGITWFEIPVKDMQRAKHFYEALLDTSLIVQRDSISGTEMVFLPPQSEGMVSGSLVKSSNFFPSENGLLVFFNCNPNLDAHLQRAVEAGALVHQPKTLIHEEIGYMAVIIDSEGNKIALHSSE